MAGIVSKAVVALPTLVAEHIEPKPGAPWLDRRPGLIGFAVQ